MRLFVVAELPKCPLGKGLQKFGGLVWKEKKWSLAFYLHAIIKDGRGLRATKKFERIYMSCHDTLLFFSQAIPFIFFI